jgi:hypothetical protein
VDNIIYLFISYTKNTEVLHHWSRMWRDGMMGGGWWEDEWIDGYKMI